MSTKRNRILFIIPYHKIGGAEKVHLEIIKALPVKPVVLFPNVNTIASDNLFKPYAVCVSYRRWIPILVLLYFNFWALFTKVIVFGCNTPIFYSLLPYFKKNIKKIDLTHAFSAPGTGMENYSLPFIKYLNTRIVINNRTLTDYRLLYEKYNIDNKYLSNFIVIPNGTEVKDFDYDVIKKRFENFTIGFVGRNSEEKRPELFFEIASKLNTKAKVVGDNFSNFKLLNPNVIYFENCNDSEVIRNEFSEISLLFITSDKEGFPLVIMEAMELGIPVVATNVGSIKEHLKTDFNGFVIPVGFICEDVAQLVNQLSVNYLQYSRLALAARQYAVNNFDLTHFHEKYLELFK